MEFHSINTKALHGLAWLAKRLEHKASLVKKAEIVTGSNQHVASG
jgi:hypothetical protein